MQELAGKVAVITGGGSGIGRGMAESFAEAGMKLVLADVDEARLHSTADELARCGAEVLTVRTDVSDPTQVQALADRTVQRFGAVHVVCNNAGVGAGERSLWEASLDDWKWVMGVNLMGVVHGIRSFVPILLKQGGEGHIVNTASMAGLTFSSDESIYSVSKFAVVALSEHLQLQLEQRRLAPRVSVLCPAFVSTDIMNAQSHRPQSVCASPQAEGEVARLSLEWRKEQIAAGMRPRAVGDLVCDAIQNQRFYVLTDPGWTPMIQARNEAVVSRKTPRFMPPPGIESLMKRLKQLAR
jgi:NAD(P)-dependent dehydrogenase (short-subunit alcohol dehydrogenase family)